MSSPPMRTGSAPADGGDAEHTSADAASPSAKARARATIVTVNI
ncbi:MAG: hypothetical protein QNJ84_11065 [Alphaproteobacteria bacterium]|nr:hypothetical protein [Alphaproteobacteria bacterium]